MAGGVRKWLALLVLTCVYHLQDIHGQTIDEAIAGAIETVGAMDFMHDDDGTVLVEMDMKFSLEDWRLIQEAKDADEEVNEKKKKRRKKRKAIRYETRRWTNKVVPYVLSNVFSGNDIVQINAAIAEWERYTCLDFRRRSSERNYIFLQNGGGCSSFVGMQGGSQPVSLARGCRIKGIIVHELGHAIGFQHEQTRPDRDSHVTIYHQNIIRGTEYNFQKYSTNTVNNFGVPYDYLSVMHYGATAFSANGRPTIVTRDRSYQNIIGNRGGMSFRDVKMANLMYRCNAQCTNRPTCPGEGFVGKDCQCWCPGNPVTLCSGGGGGGATTTTTTIAPTTTTQGGGGGGGGGDCEDKNRFCEYWASIGECENNKAYMHENCKKSCELCDGGGGGGGSNCRDHNTHCPSWATQGYCRSNPGYMLAYCKRSCNSCNGGGGGGGGGGTTCTNGHNMCTYWARYGYCTSPSYRAYMERTCRSACGLCNGGSSNPGGSCVNTHQNCAYWARIGECRNNPAFMHLHCRRSCGLCSGKK